VHSVQGETGEIVAAEDGDCDCGDAIGKRRYRTTIEVVNRDGRSLGAKEPYDVVITIESIH
jgi:hypothetical protein